ncbi:beta-glucosidase [Teredinibacter purpureus]|uniref:beta-glucosidase n=1 Tax=Teredinibacter purpureus TaxID=2731756 RepID=UPI0009E63E0B|nr:glycoside hydrolase family 3 C-terminal domain-containing protein [Teredinibacter purpureus]
MKTFSFLLVGCIVLTTFTGCSPISMTLSKPLSTSQLAVMPSSVSKTTPAAIEQEVERLLAALTLSEKISLLHANSKFTVAGVERLGIEEMHLSDGPHGVRHEISRHSWAPADWDTDYATYLPPLTAIAASWDPAMATLHGTVLGREARHRNKDIILGPGVNLARLPTYGRNFEYFGEDPFLAAQLVVPEILAIQQHDVAACVKHYALNTQELNRWGVDAQPDERTLREVYLPAFEAAVKEGGVYSVMGAYNKVYGTNANQSAHLVNGILKQDWGFDGVLLTDWHVDINTVDAAMNGLDLEMGTLVEDYDDYYFAAPLLAKVQEGEIPEAIIDEKVRRILRLQLRVGMMDPLRQEGLRNTEEHHRAARTLAEQGIVLLKNDQQLLPLQKDTLKNVLVMGPNANLPHGRGGGSSQVKSNYEITPLQGLQTLLGDDVNIVYLRAGTGDTLQPIPADYISTRHGGSGTPVWRVISFEDAERQQPLNVTEWPQSSKRWAHNTDTQYLTLEATLVPIESGEHIVKFHGSGHAQLHVDGESVASWHTDGQKVLSQTLNLTAGQAYTFQLQYDGNTYFTLGWDAPGIQVVSEAVYTEAAKKADLVLYFGGLSHSDDREGHDRESMRLPGNQDEVITALHRANATTTVFIIAGSAVEMPWANDISTLVWGWYGGMEAGHAYARMLTGAVNPAGKMPITLPKQYADTAPIKLDDYNDNTALYKEGVFIGYRWFEAQSIEVQFPFGHGLSYTQFDIDNLSVPKVVDANAEKTVISVTLKNTGKRTGAEVVQLYLGDAVASVARPIKELKGFKKVTLAPGESQTVMFELKPRDFAFWDIQTNGWLVEQGNFNIYVGVSSEDIRAQGVLHHQ